MYASEYLIHLKGRWQRLQFQPNYSLFFKCMSITYLVIYGYPLNHVPFLLLCPGLSNR